MKPELDGTWTGITKTWLDADAPPDEAKVSATITTVVERWMRIAYTSTVAGKPHTGEMTFGFHKDPQQYEMALIDTFHTGSAIMLSVSKPECKTIDVLGSYAAGPERWGWRTVLESTSADEIVIRSFNIEPSGKEYPAIETRLHRS